MSNSSPFSIILLIALLANPIFVSALETEYITDGHFELGTMNVDIQRYPRYPLQKPDAIPRIVKAENNKERCLLLPSLPEGGYRFTYEPIELKPSERYDFRAIVRSGKDANIRVEVRSGSQRIVRKIWSLDNDSKELKFYFISAASQNTDTSVHSLRIWVQPKEDTCLKLVSLRGPATKNVHSQPIVNITPDQPTGVYGLGETAYMNVTMALSLKNSAYRIINPVAQTVTVDKTLIQKTNGESKISLPTNERGFFIVDMLDDASEKILLQRSYVVINRKTKNTENSQRYGLDMEEEHSVNTVTYAKSTPEDVYQIAADIGADSIRIFALASPEKLSTDGIRYDYHEIDSGLDLAEKYNLSVLLELGINELHKIPAWLRTDNDSVDTIELESVLHTKRQKKAFERTIEKGRYLSLNKYRLYLQRLFEHLEGRVAFFEIWNEPGHKFSANDYIRIARITRSVQSEFAPHAKLLGPTSSTIQEHGKGRNQKALPGFVGNIMNADADKNIDILSYHSRHAFPFMGKNFDRRNQETGYAHRLKQVLIKAGVSQLPIWDTERGVPWKTYHPQRTDIWQDEKGHDAWVTSFDYLEPARRLPGIFSAAWAGNVERLFWFNVDPGTSTIARARVRWGFFDADMEPMPHIAAYDAYSELVGNAIFYKLVDRPDGTRCYVFSRDGMTILVAFNWQGSTGTINIKAPGSQIDIIDVMGNEVAKSRNQYQLSAGSWAHYVVIDSLPETVTIN